MFSYPGQSDIRSSVGPAHSGIDDLVFRYHYVPVQVDYSDI